MAKKSKIVANEKRKVCVERGAESDMMAFDGFLAINHVWRGQLADAAAEAGIGLTLLPVL